MRTPADQGHREIIRTQFGETLFVEAGAGTGKTTELVARVVHMVATGHLTRMSDLAAITFTENAAAELRNRIRESLQAAANGDVAGAEYDPCERQRLACGLANLDDAVLTTLHGFASRILSEAPLEAALPPGFSIATASGGGEDAERSWDDFVDGLLDNRAVREQLLCGLTLGLKLSQLRTVATALGSSWDRLRSRPLTPIPVPAISAIEVLRHLAVALADDGRWPEGDALTNHLDGAVRSLVVELAALDDPLDILEALERAEIPCSNGRKPAWTAKGLDKGDVADALKAADQARKTVIQGVGSAVTATLAAQVQDWLLGESVRRRKAGMLDYHDLLVLARDVLRAEPDVRRRLHEQWPTLLIDEFQDTDPLQAEIAYLLGGSPSDDGPGAWDEIAVEGGRLFFVGDAKQSIYRFRRADIDIFNAVGKQHVPARLTVNFRSVPGILDAVNAAFGELIGHDTPAGIPYTDLEPFREAPDASSPVLLLGGPHPGLPASELRELESTHVADVAVRVKREGWRIRSGTASYQDMAILLPTRTSLPALEQALQDRGVPYRVESRSLVWSTDAVRGLVAVLQAIDRPADEVALLAALRHPGLACSDVDLLTWRAAGGRWSIFAETPADLTAEHPVAAALGTLRSWHDERWWLPVNQLVERVVADLRLVELTASQRRPRDHWRRLRFLVDQARAWCDSGGSGLGSFVTWAVRQMDDDVDVLETVVPEPDDDAVRILTVHGAKGLEFPIALLAGLAVIQSRYPHVLWTDTGPDVRLLAGKLETGGFAAAAGVETEQARREANRLLYVAATRAMDHLVIGCYHSPPGPTAQQSGAQRLWHLLSGNGLVATELALPEPGAPLNPPVPLPAPTLPDRGAFAVDRLALLAAVRRRVATSPTALTADATASMEDETAVEPDRATGSIEPTDAGSQPRKVWRSSSRGTAIGTATHRVLELVDLKNPDRQHVRALTRLACAEQQIPELQANIEGRVWSALGSDVLAAALTRAAGALPEVYLVVHDGDRFLEGYLDLLIDEPGGLSILDYKTDRATTEAEIAAKRQHYAPQLAAYARAVEQITGRAPRTTDLIFAKPGGHPL